MWVISQDKKILIDENKVYICKLRNGKYGLYTSYYLSFLIGKYSTKEKALKVLDMIQSRIIHKEENLLNSQYQEPIIVNTNDIVFQMPTDDEVEV